MRYGLIAERLGHSFSKPIHEKLADYTYDLMPMPPEEVGPFLTRREFAAINVTIPYKETVIPYCDSIDGAAAAMGAVNTIVNRGGKLCGYNTDFAGAIYMLRSHGIDLAGRTVLILGTGGTCKTFTAVAEHLGAKEVLRAGRTAAPGVLDYAAVRERRDIQVILNASPRGMFPHGEEEPLVHLDDHPHLEAVADAVYNPLRTRLLQEAAARGLKTAGGLTMLVAQAKYAVEHFLNPAIDDARIDEIAREILSERSNMVLIGMPSAGKSTLGDLLAARTGRRVADMDSIITERIGMPIADFFAQSGEAAFRALEHRVAEELAQETGIIISTGGGAVKDPANMACLARNGVILAVDRSLEKLLAGNGRPLSSSPEAVARLYAERMPLYRRYGQAIIDNNGSASDAADAALAAYSSIVGGQL